MVNDTRDRKSFLMNRKHMSPSTEERVDVQRLHQLYNDILKPLTLFPNHSPRSRREKKDEVYSRSAAPFMKDMRTVSPDVLCDMVRRRLHKLLPFTSGSTDVQKVFEEIILSEVKVACDGIPHVLCTTLLNSREKHRLHRRVLDHIMIVSEQLFLHYLHRMDWRKSHSLFTEEADLTRCKAQLLLDCSKFFNVFSASHYLIAEIKELEGKESDDQTDLFSQQSHKKKAPYKSFKQTFTMEYFVRLGRPDIAVHKVQRETDLMQIKNIQRPDLEKVRKLFSGQEDYSTFTKNVQCEAVTTACSFRHEEEEETEEEKGYAKCTLIKVKSMSCPNLRSGDLLADELRITFKPYPAECPNIVSIPHTKVEANPVSDDLRRLIQDSTLPSTGRVERQYSDEEIPPLISAIAPGYRNAARRKKMEAVLQSLNKKSAEPKEMEKTQTIHPQTFTVDVQIPNKPLVRRADMQASDRIFTHLTEMQKYPPIYNDFASEIDSATVKKLDRNLYVGQELEEVYTELVKNLSTNHLKFDQDLEFEPYATKLDFSVCTASSTLTKKTNQRVINKELDSLAAINDVMQHMPTDKEASRNVNSWLVWWKSIVNTDDYMKYVSTQDLDYLKVIYHLYNSDSEDEEQAHIALMKKQEEQKRQRERKIADLRAEKQSYSPGMWNVNSVMLGGLGSDPHRVTSASYLDLQNKINAVWNALHVPEGQRLDMAIKYSSNEYRDRLPEAIRVWEKAVILIQRREKMLAELEIFEREASDPNRFFLRGYKGTSVARMEESKQRQKLYKQMSHTEHAIAKVLQMIKRTFNDTVSYKGRPYTEKMKWDKTEMLYWLQQDRRKTLMVMDTKKESMN
ncbi:PREDICTED: coiled-coil domain-containing protein 87, partial [Nanorana parkeri]|uniref:coiled-coil domain-containing protein 87 n=1 Tax=Nanorana parkeri TaxID=125878 RepID=UPI000854DF5D